MIQIVKNSYLILSGLFGALVLFSNLVSVKMATIFGLSIPIGLFFYPISFILSNLVSEIFGTKSAKKMVYFTLGLNTLVLCGLLLFGVHLAAMRILSSLVAYLAGQLAGIYLFSHFKKSRALWLRTTGAAMGGLLIDTFCIDGIYLYGFLQFEAVVVLKVIAVSYFYKALISVASIPFIKGRKVFRRSSEGVQ